jgi:hypothetical protein
MGLTPGMRLGPYEVFAAIGRGPSTSRPTAGRRIVFDRAEDNSDIVLIERK